MCSAMPAACILQGTPGTPGRRQGLKPGLQALSCTSTFFTGQVRVWRAGSKAFVSRLGVVSRTDHAARQCYFYTLKKPYTVQKGLCVICFGCNCRRTPAKPGVQVPFRSYFERSR